MQLDEVQSASALHRQLSEPRVMAGRSRLEQKHRPSPLEAEIEPGGYHGIVEPGLDPTDRRYERENARLQ